MELVSVFGKRASKRTTRSRFSSRCAAMAIVAGCVMWGAVDGARADVPAARSALLSGDCAAAGAAINEGLAREDAEAFFFAGLLYDQSSCVEHDAARAARLYRRAAALGYSAASPYLGMLYALGQGVPQDYAMAHRAFHADAAGAVDGNAAAGEEAALGYAETLARLAMRRVTYPPTANSVGIEASMEVILTPQSDTIDLEQVHVETEIGSSLPRTRDFTEQIEAAYRVALAAVPRLVPAADPSLRIDTPWKFQMQRTPDNRKTRLEGFVSFGDSRVVH